MDVFNRIVIILLLLAAMILIPLALIFPEQAEIVLRRGADTIQLNLDWLYSRSQTYQIGMRLVLAAVGLIVFLVCLLFLVLEIIRIRRRTVMLRDGSGELMLEGISGHLAYHIDLLPDVLHVKPKVTSKRKRVRAFVYVETAPGIRVPEKSAEIKETARRVIEDQLGLEVDKEIRVIIKPLAYPKVPREQRRPPAPVEQPVELQPFPAPVEQPVELQLPPVPVEQPVELQFPPAPVEQPAELQLFQEEAETLSGLEDFTPPEEAPQEPQADSESQTIEVKGPSSESTQAGPSE